MDNYSNYDFSNYDYSSSYSSSSSMSGPMLAVMLVVYGIIFVCGIITIIGMWKAYTKANKPGWASIIPIYREIVQLEIAGRPAWWVLLMMFVPLFGTWVAIVALIDLAKSYGKSGGFAALLILVPVVGWPMLGFGKDRYLGPVATNRTDFMPSPDAPAAATYAPVGQVPVAPAAPVSVEQPTPPQPPQQ